MNILTKRQQETLKVIHKSIQEEGSSPTYVELRKKLKVSSNQTVNDLICALCKKGYLEVENRKARAMKLTRKAIKELTVKYINFESIRFDNAELSFNYTNNQPSSSNGTREIFNTISNNNQLFINLN